MFAITSCVHWIVLILSILNVDLRYVSVSSKCLEISWNETRFNTDFNESNVVASNWPNRSVSEEFNRLLCVWYDARINSNNFIIDGLLPKAPNCVRLTFLSLSEVFVFDVVKESLLVAVEVVPSELMELFGSLLLSNRFFNCWGEEGIGGKVIFDAVGIGGVVSSTTQANIDKIL